MKILINTRNIKIIEKEKIYTGNVNTYIINVEYEDYNFFSEYNCYLTFKNNDLKKKVIIGPDLKVIIPFDVLSETGNLIIGFFAIKVDEKEKLIRYSSEIEVLPVEKGGFDEEASEPEELTPTILEKYLQEMKNFYNESLEGYNTNAINKTEEFNKNYENKIKAYNDNSIQKINEYNKNADKREEEINNKVSDIEKIEDNIEQIQKNVQASEQNAKTSETNAKTSEINAQKSAENASEVLTNVTTIQEDINKSKGEINTVKESIDNSVKNVEKLVDEATNQANISKEQAEISKENANQTTSDKNAVENTKNDVSAMKSSVEQAKSATEQIKADTQTIYDNTVIAKNETLEAKEEVENSLEKERIISDKKYAKAIDSEVIEIDNFGQVECDDDGYMKDIEIESNLEVTQDVTETSPSLDYPSEFKNIINDIKIQNIQENLVYIDNESYIPGYTAEKAGIQYTIQDDFGLKCVGTATENSNVQIIIRENGKKKLTVKNLTEKIYSYITGDSISGARIIAHTIDGEYIPISNTGFNLTNDLFFDNVYAEVTAGNTVDCIIYPQLTYKEADKYIPYNGYKKEIVLPENNFLGNFNGYKNIIKNGKLKCNLKIYKLDANMDFSVNDTDTTGVQFLTPIVEDLKSNLSAKNILSTISKNLVGSTASKKIRFIIPYKELGTTSENTKAEHIAALKNKLSNITGEFLYPVDNEEETSLEDINLPLYKGINNIYAEDLKLNFKYNISIEKYIEDNNIIERRISDNKYARALKAQIEDVEQAQIYADNSEVENLVIKGAPLTQTLTEQSENIILLEDYPTTNNNGVDITVKDNKITLNGTATAAFNLQLPIKYTTKKSISGDWCLGYITSGDLSSGNGNIQVYGSNNQNIKIYFPKSSNPLTNYTKKTFDNVELNTSHINIYMNNVAVADNIVIDFTLANVSSLDAGIPFTPNSPSLDFPSEIQVASEQNMQICKSNLFNTEDFINELKKVFTVTEEVVDGVDCYRVIRTVDWQKEYEVNIKCKSIIKFKYKKEAEGGIIVENNDGTYKALSNTSELSEFESISQSGFNSIRIELYSTTYPLYISKDIQINCGDTSLEYEPYEGQDIFIPLQNLAIGQYADIIDRKNNIQNKVIREKTLTGNEDFKNATYEPGEGFYAYYIKLNMLKLQNIKTFCNYFKQHNEAGNIQEECFTIPNTGNIVFVVQNYTTIEEFKTKLQELYEAGTPVKVYYVSETVDKIPLSEEVKKEINKFKLYDNLNNVFIDKGTLSFKYNKSLLKAFEEQSELSASLLERIQALEAAQVNSAGGN